MRKNVLTWLSVLLLAIVSSVALAAAGNGPGDGTCDGTCDGTYCTPNPDCPDDDGDGICNGQDPDHLPGGNNPDCPDADGDGICNGQDPDFVPHSGTGRWAKLICQVLVPGIF